MATTTPKTLVHGQITGTSASTYYTVPSLTTSIIRMIKVVNPDATASYTFDLYRNGSADANRLTETVTVPANGAYQEDVYEPLAATDTIQAKASTANKLTLIIGGAEIT